MKRSSLLTCYGIPRHRNGYRRLERLESYHTGRSDGYHDVRLDLTRLNSKRCIDFNQGKILPFMNFHSLPMKFRKPSMDLKAEFDDNIVPANLNCICTSTTWLAVQMAAGLLITEIIIPFTLTCFVTRQPCSTDEDHSSQRPPERTEQSAQVTCTSRHNDPQR